jgi:hypothetical protein
MTGIIPTKKPYIISEQSTDIVMNALAAIHDDYGSVFPSNMALLPRHHALLDQSDCCFKQKLISMFYKRMFEVYNLNLQFRPVSSAS